MQWQCYHIIIAEKQNYRNSIIDEIEAILWGFYRFVVPLNSITCHKWLSDLIHHRMHDSISECRRFTLWT